MSKGRQTKRREVSSAALVLGGGGARGAYEVGVLHYLFEDLPRRIGRAPRFPILSGTSAGAINVCAIGARADQPLRGVATLAQRWAGLRAETIVRIDRCEIAGMIRALLGGKPGRLGPVRLKGALLDPAPLQALLTESLAFDALARQVGAGTAISVTATNVSTGRAAVFVAGAGARAPWRRRATDVLPVSELRLDHVLASASIPLLFPSVEIDGRLYCDGSLREHVPLSPALHLGAERLVVVSTQHASGDTPPHLRQARELAYPSPLFLIGRALEALTLDRIDDDLERLERINEIVAAGGAAFGDGFTQAIGDALAAQGAPPVRPVRVVAIRPSEPLGRLAADYVRSRRFRPRLSGTAGRLLGRLADADADREADLLSFLLFDGPFAAELMELGRADARREEDRFCSLLGGAPRPAALVHRRAS